MTSQHSIPFIDLRKKTPVDLVSGNKQKTLDMIHSIRKIKGTFSHIATKAGFIASDRFSKNWLKKSNNPYYEEIAAYDRILKTKGVYTLNLSYEWGCTTSVMDTKDGPVMTRVLDWPFPSMDDSMVVAHQYGPAGDFYNVTWPGMAGVFNAVARKRFSAALNQAPMRRSKRGIKTTDWLQGRIRLGKTSALPPAHLLRQTMENAKDYAQAKKMLSETPVAIPVIFILAGTKAGEGCVIERTENSAHIREMQNGRVSVSNHFQSPLKDMDNWQARRECSYPRAVAGNAINLRDVDGKFSWFKQPIANEYSRLAMTGNARKGKMNLIGTNGPKQTTRIFKI